MIFDGKAYAKEIEEKVKNRVEKLEPKPKIVSVLVGNDPASVLYTKLKREAAERVGIQFDIFKLEITNNQAPIIKQKIIEIGSKVDVSGVMVQLPLPACLPARQGVSRKDTEEILAAIPLDKDVDGLRYRESGVMPATVRAILSILDKIAIDSRLKIQDSRVVVVGAKGSVGTPLVYYLQERGIKVSEVEWDSKLPAGSLPEGEVVISCVGKEGFITPEMIGKREVVIDVGAPRGDMTNEVYQKAVVAVGVPNGVGPVTIASLLANAEELYERYREK